MVAQSVWKGMNVFLFSSMLMAWKGKTKNISEKMTRGNKKLAKPAKDQESWHKHMNTMNKR